MCLQNLDIYLQEHTLILVAAITTSREFNLPQSSSLQNRAISIQTAPDSQNSLPKYSHYKSVSSSIYYLPEMRTYHQIPGKSVFSVSNIMEQFRAFDLQNRELLRLTQDMHRSSFFNTHLPPPIIQRFQEELRGHLSKLAQNIRQVFIDTDKKLKNLTHIIEQQPLERNHSALHQTYQQQAPKDPIQRPRENTVYRTNNIPVDPYPSLIERITQLEISLKNTQQNEARLISMIEKLEKFNQEVPTQTTHSPQSVQSKVYKALSRHSLAKTKKSSQSQSTFRLFSLHNKSQDTSMPEKNTEKGAEQNRPISNPFACFSQQNVSLEPSRIENSTVHPYRTVPHAPTPSFDKNYTSTHSHRLSFMVNTLNS